MSRMLFDSCSIESMEMEEIIVKLDLVFKKPSGEKFPVTIKIGKPYEINDNENGNYAACPLSTQGFFGRHPDIRGEDTFQALLLALDFVQRLIADFLKKGGKIYYADEESEFDPDIYFDIFRL
ncbi:hypothetical protein JW926_09830 [Candidatus Sumerlaeota bacterium]|nr:hypothetical protein [Candidatus Sumerlaeota bacterium]